jgi:hypothetical protein
MLCMRDNRSTGLRLLLWAFDGTHSPSHPAFSSATPQSPSSEAVLAAIRAVTGPAGCLLVVKSYTGAQYFDYGDE